jgi:hypothetical protein
VSEPSVFEIRPHRGGWQCYEGPGVEPYFTGADGRAAAISYAKGRTAHRYGEIRVFNAAGDIEETIAFDERARRL